MGCSASSSLTKTEAPIASIPHSEQSGAHDGEASTPQEAYSPSKDQDSKNEWDLEGASRVPTYKEIRNESQENIYFKPTAALYVSSDRSFFKQPVGIESLRSAIPDSLKYPRVTQERRQPPRERQEERARAQTRHV